jgi:HK97 family phage portal protein
MWRPQQRRGAGLSMVDLIPSRSDTRGSNGRGLVAVTPDTALRHSAVWACLRIRADLVSTFPVDVFRKFGAIDVEMAKPPVLVDPGGRFWPYMHWMWASQFEVDRTGNTIGLITEKNALGLPAKIELQPGPVSCYQTRTMPEHKYRIDGKEYTADQVWHERQFPVPGLPVGLSPVAYAAWTLQEQLTMQQFALDWFGSGVGVPKVHLKNTKKTLDAGPQNNEARRVKDRYMATVTNGDAFVTGNDWEIDFTQGQQAGMEWLEARRFGLPEVGRFFGCPVDLIDAAISAPGTVTYQSALQRNLQFLVMNLNAPIIRRETALSTLLPRPRFVKLNTNALLRMDPETQAQVIKTRIESRTLAPSEGRELYNLPPFTPEQEAEIARLLGGPRTAPDTAARESGWWEQVSPYSAAPYDAEMVEVTR